MRSGAKTMFTLKRRSEFQRVRGGGRWSTPAFLVEGKPRDPAGSTIRGPRFGFTVTKKLGGAVTRNRIRRRLKSAIDDVANDFSQPQFDYVIVARMPALDRDYTLIKADLQLAFRRVHDGGAPASKPAPAKNRGGQ